MRLSVSVILLASSLCGCGLNLQGAGSEPRSDGGLLVDGPPLVDAGDEDSGGGGMDSTVDTAFDAPTIRESGADSARDAGSDAPGVDSSPPPDLGVACGTSTCVAPNGCCLSSGQCDVKSNCGAWAGCDDRHDCAGGELCCAGVHNGNGSLDWADCKTPADCAAVGGSETGYELCDPMAANPCTSGSCTGSFSNGYSYCQ